MGWEFDLKILNWWNESGTLIIEKRPKKDDDLILTIQFDLMVENPFLTSHIRNPFSYDTSHIYIYIYIFETILLSFENKRTSLD